MDTISILTYYFNLIWTYATYYALTTINIFSDYDPSVKISAIVTTFWIFFMLVVGVETIRQLFIKEHRKATRKRIEQRYGEGIKRILWDTEVSDDLSQQEIISILGIDSQQMVGKKLLNTKIEKQVFCRMVYDLIIHDYMREGRDKNLQQILEIFHIQKFLEDDVNFGTKWNKVSAITMLRTFKLYISPWVLNKLVESKRSRIRRLAMYSAVRSSSENDLETFETEFFEKNSCIYDEIMIGYELQRRKKNGLRLPSMALWTTRFSSPDIKCMLVRLMRRFEQREYCYQLKDLFLQTHHKKLVEEICRTWGYLQYRDSEDLMAEAFSLQTDDTKVAIMHALARLRSGKNMNIFVYSYQNSNNPHVRFEALRCLYNYGREGKMALRELEKKADEKEKMFFAFFHNPITLDKIPLDELQIYHQTIETSFIA